MKSIGSDSELPPSPYVGTIMGSIAEEDVDENIDLIGLSGFAAYCLWTIRRAAIHGDGNSDDRHSRCLDAHANGDEYSHEHTHSHNDEHTPPTPTATVTSTPSPSPTHDPNRFYASAGRFSMILPTGWNIVELQEFDDIGFTNRTDYHIWYGVFEK